MATFTSLTSSPYANWMDKEYEVGAIHQIIKTATQITVVSSEPDSTERNRLDYFGTFTYSGDSVSGTLNSFARTDPAGPVRYTVKDLSLDAASVSAFMLSGTDAELIPIAFAGNDRLVGNEWSILLGYGGDDTFVATSLYSVSFDGGDGIDTVVFEGGRGAVNITTRNFLYKNLTERSELYVESGMGSAHLKDVERLQFADTALALDIAGNAGQAYRLYRAAFDRMPDHDGLGFWISAMDHGATLQTVAAGFVNSREFKDLFAYDPTDRAVLTAFYRNVLHREPDQGGFDFWLAALEKGLGKDQLLVNFSESAENKAQVIGSIQNGIEYHPYG